MLTTYSAGAGSLTYFAELANFFRLMDANGPVTVYFYWQGQEIARAENVGEGYAEKFAHEFDKVAISSATAQSIQFAMRLGNEIWFDAPPTGNVAVTNTGGAFTQSNKTVTSASAVMQAANASRRYLMVQNKDTAGSIYLNLAGAAATYANGVKLGPGDSLELSTYCPTGAIYAIGDMASNANVTVVEG